MKYKLSQLPQLGPIKKIFFIGIKGVGVAPLALIAKGAGIEVAGSDVAEEFITDYYLRKEGVRILEGFNPQEILSFFGDTSKEKCLVITTGALKGFDNLQAIWAKENNVNLLSQGQALALFMKGDILGRDDFKSIAVAGSHGKTTISALLATTLHELGLDSTYTVGTGEIFPLGPPGHYGKGDYFVAEADEYFSEPVYDKVPKFLYQTPQYAIFNNIDFDHPDVFANVSEVSDAFLEFADTIQSGGTLFVNGDDKYLGEYKKVIQKDIRVITYGQDSKNDYIISKIVTHGLTSMFTAQKKGKELGVFELSVPGIHNAKNALSVVAFLAETGFDTVKIRESLKVFRGTKRRSEVVGNAKGGALLVDDYGHHPLEIETTIKAIKEAYSGKKIVCIFQPHTYSRTKALLPEFGKAFGNADKLILLPVFKSARDTEKDTLKSDAFVNAYKPYVDTDFFEKFEDVVEYIEKNFASNEYLILTIGAGDVYKIAYELKEK